MSFDAGILEEFSLEAEELLNDAEDALLKLKGDENYQEIYNSVFRAFHSLKGSSGMMGFEALQSHLHLLEDFLQKSKGSIEHFKTNVDYYLSGIDASRKILHGEQVSFKYEVYANKADVQVSIKKSSRILICVLSNPTDDLLKISQEIARANSLELKQMQLTDLSKEYLQKLDYVGIVSDLPLTLFLPNIPAKKEKRPFLYVAKDYSDSLLLEHRLFFVVSENILRLKFLLQQMLHDELNRELYDSARGLMMYMFSDMEEYLLKNNKNEIHKSISHEIREFIKKFGK